MAQFIDSVNSLVDGHFGMVLEGTGVVIGLLLLVRYKSFFGELLQPSGERSAGPRNHLADMMKGIAIHGVVIIHIDSYFRYFHQNETTTFFTLLAANISRFAVPWFIITSGMFLNWKSAELYWSSKIRNLVIPFVLICIIAYPLKFRLEEGWFADFVMRTLNGSVFTPYYFVPLLVEFYILYAVIFRKAAQKNMPLYLMASFLVNLVSNHFLEKIVPPGPVAASLFTNYIFYFIFGMAVGSAFRNGGVILNAAKNHKQLLNSFAGGIIFYLATVAHGTWHFHYEVSNHFLFYPVAAFVAVYLVLIDKESVWLVYTGKNSLGIFLLHPFVIHMMHSFDPYILGGPVVAWIIALVLNLVLPLAVWRGVAKLIEGVVFRG